MQYLADQKPQSGLAPQAGTFERYRLQEWLNFITAELHKPLGSLFNPATPEDYKPIAKETLAARFAYVDRHLASGGPFLMGAHFTVADAYLFVMTLWAKFLKFDLDQFTTAEGLRRTGGGTAQGSRGAERRGPREVTDAVAFFSHWRPRRVRGRQYISRARSCDIRLALPPAAGFGFTEKPAEARYRLDSETRFGLARSSASSSRWRYGRSSRRAGRWRSDAPGAGPTISAWPRSTRSCCESCCRGRRLRSPRPARLEHWGLFNNLPPAIERHLPRAAIVLVVGDTPRPRDLPAARDVPCGAGVLARPSDASRGPRFRRHHRRALPSAGNSYFDGHQDRRGCRARRAAVGRTDFRGRAQRDFDVQSQQRANPARRGPPASMAAGHARHASRPSLGHPRRDQ